MALKVEELGIALDNKTTLLDLAPGNSGTILELPEIVMLSSLGIRKNKVVHCCSHQLFGGPIVVKTGNRQIALHRSLAKQIIIQPI